MNTPPSPPGTERTDESAVRIGALVPLTRPGWVEAGRHLLAGLELAVCEVRYRTDQVPTQFGANPTSLSMRKEATSDT